ncbi:MAG: adenylate/guanylate cyclase domain-containing protein [Holophagae bacterium]|jgi:class 3 adenylate cyclase
MTERRSITSYRPAEVQEYPGKWLVAVSGSGPNEVFLFFDRVEIGRYKPDRKLPAHLMVRDNTVSSLHCTITQEPDGRCFIRDTSRNGTRVDGRRLSPNLTTELEIGQTISVGRHLQLRLDGQPPPDFVPELEDTETQGFGASTTVTVLVGDVSRYTEIVRLSDMEQVQESVNNVFRRLEREVEAMGGTLKEFQGDALFAFWEKGPGGCHACQACRAALHLNRVVPRLAADPSVWKVAGFPLEMDFALSSGLVTISGYGTDGAMGLSMVGESVVLAYRIEKLAGPETAPIVTCSITKQMAQNEFRFRDLGVHTPKGFDEPLHLFGLLGESR